MCRYLIGCILLLWTCALTGVALASPATGSRGPVRDTRALDDADPDATHDIMAMGAGQVTMTLSNFGEYGNPNFTPGFQGFECPVLSGNDFLFSAGIWVGALVDGAARVSTGTDGDNGTGEFWPVHIGTVPVTNEQRENYDWHFASRHTPEYAGVQYVVGTRGIDDDHDWSNNEDLNGNGVPDANWDGGSGWIGSDDDADGAVDEEAADLQDNDMDGRVDEDTDPASDANADANCGYDPEGRVDEDPVGDISSDHLDNDHDGLADAEDPNHDGDFVVGSNDDDGDGMEDEDADAYGELEAHAVFQDSISQQYVSSPSGPHVPLNIEVAQRAMAWPGGHAAWAIAVEYSIRNLGITPLEHVYLAAFADPDINAAGEGGDAGSLDDYNYFDAARSMAVHGDDSSDADGPGPGVFAMKLLRTPAPLSALRFAFRNFERQSGGDPEFDADKYVMMTSGSIDPPAMQLGDWRMLMAFGADATDGFTIAPSHALDFTVAFIGAPERAMLSEIADAFEDQYLTGSLTQAPLPPENFRKTATAAGTVSLAWSPPNDPTITSYSLYGIEAGGVGARALITTTADTLYTHGGLNNGDDWLYELHAMSADDNVSMPVYRLVRVAAPDPLPGLSAFYQDGAVRLHWFTGPEPDIVDYRIQRVDFWTADTADFTVIGDSYVDAQIALGHTYSYRVAARNSLGVTGIWSDAAEVTPWGPVRRVLLLDEYTDTPVTTGGIPRDSVRAMYLTLLTELSTEFTYGTVAEYGSLDSIALFDRVVYVNENRSAANSPAREEAIAEYLANGGKLLRFGRRLCASAFALNRGVHRLSPDGLRPMTFDSVYASVWTASRPGMQFVGAQPAAPGFPEVVVDQTRLDSLHFGTYSYDYLPEVDVFWPDGATYPLYRTEVLPTDSSGYADQPCAVYTAHHIAVAFPLYFLPHETAQQLLGACLTALDTITSDVDPPAHVPPMVEQFRLLPGFPNPFNPLTTLRFELSTASHVRLEIFDVLGRLTTTLIHDQLPAGVHQTVWNAGPAASGIYFARLTAGTHASTQKLVLLK